MKLFMRRSNHREHRGAQWTQLGFSYLTTDDTEHTVKRLSEGIFYAESTAITHGPE